ncbi:DUF916 and DUF3324 domain-containing protein [Vagococcus sp. DIV0080]|uniref:DUF916 and DUF3324 domain-containing protein n=1 Tax=Candidatus Vagococcus giribetii TaxID=2230876 RepID=A0ABS3HT14_9ENTE|nr:DUF916 and DUF3324 domain-containing protein [Vagococcus sp. DIV0080]MBO0476480.1 DUF916 and DUF3324 domain-containing protein [Vagococcus sp. DIV0080]
MLIEQNNLFYQIERIFIMKKSNTLLITIFLLFSSLSFFNLTSLASDSENMNFSMGVTPPNNQVNKEVTYLDFKPTPGKSQKLEVTVTNTGKEKKKIRVTPTNSITNPNGIIDYSIQEKNYRYDDSLTIPFTTLVGDAQSVNVNPGKTETLLFDFTPPKQGFEGIILGGFVADLVDTKEETSQNENISFVNKFQLVKAVVIHGNEQVVEPDFVLHEVKPALYSYRTAVTANLQNKSPMLLSNVNVKADISKKGSDITLKSEDRRNIEFAPNSNFDFPIMWDNDPLDPGDYIINITVIANKQEFKFTEEFKISKNQSEDLNQNAVNLENETKDNLMWLIISGLFILVIIFLVLFIIIDRKKRNKKKRKKTRPSKKNKVKVKSKKK